MYFYLKQSKLTCSLLYTSRDNNSEQNSIRLSFIPVSGWLLSHFPSILFVSLSPRILESFTLMNQLHVDICLLEPISVGGAEIEKLSSA